MNLIQIKRLKLAVAFWNNPTNNILLINTSLEINFNFIFHFTSTSKVSIGEIGTYIFEMIKV